MMSQIKKLSLLVLINMAAATSAYAARIVDTANQKLIGFLKAINQEFEVPTLQSFGVERQYFDGVLDTMCEQAFGSGSPNNNPRVPDTTQMLSLYRKLWD